MFCIFWNWYVNSVNMIEVLNFILSYSLHLYCRIPCPPTDMCQLLWRTRYILVTVYGRSNILCVYIISFSAVQIYDLSYIYLHSSPSTGKTRTHKVTSSQLVWQLSWKSTAPVYRSLRSWVRIPIRPEFFSGFNFKTA